MTERRRLPNRRETETTTFVDERGREYGVSWSRYSTGEVGEVFFSQRGRAGSDTDAALYDAGVLASLAFQFGLTPRDLAASVARNEDGSGASPVGRALDLLAGEP